MREKKPKDLPERLKQAEQSAIMLREVCKEELKNCGSDPEKLANMVRCLGWISLDDERPEGAEPICTDDDLMCVCYDFVDEICQHVRTLSPKGSQRFYRIISESGWMYYFGIM